VEDGAILNYPYTPLLARVNNKYDTIVLSCIMFQNTQHSAKMIRGEIGMIRRLRKHLPIKTTNNMYKTLV